MSIFTCPAFAVHRIKEELNPDTSATVVQLSEPFAKLGGKLGHVFLIANNTFCA